MISFTVPYPGAAASTNHGYFIVNVGGHARLALTPEARAFIDEVTLLAKQAIIAEEWHPAPGSSLWVTINGYFPTRKHSDVHNMAKFILDSIEDALNCFIDVERYEEGEFIHNDRYWGLTVDPPQYRPGEAMLEVTVRCKERPVQKEM